MKPILFLALAATLLAAPILLAQQPAQQPQAQSPAAKKPKPVDPADVETLTGRQNDAQTPETAPRAGHALGGQPAPKLGHPLDPADVDVLTGKGNGYTRYGTRGYVTPYGYPDYAVGGSQFGGSQFAPVSTATSPLFVPQAFGRIGNRSFLVLGTATGRSTLFFAPGAFGRRSSFFIIP